MGEAGTTDSDCHFSLFGQGRYPPRTRLRPSNKGDFSMKGKKSNASVSVDNIYKLDGRVPVAKAIPFGLQHVLAMFVANVTPVMLIASVAVYNGVAFTAIDTALLIQAAVLVAGIGTLIQLYPIWRIGSRLPVVMGLSFTFFVCDDDACGQRLRPYDRRGRCGRLHRGPSGPDGEILAALCQPDRLGVRRDDHRLQPAFYRHLVLRELFRVPHRRVAEPSCCGHYAGGLPHLQFFCKGLLEAALRALRPDRGLYRLAVFSAWSTLRP